MAVWKKPIWGYSFAIKFSCNWFNVLFEISNIWPIFAHVEKFLVPEFSSYRYVQDVLKLLVFFFIF